MERGHLPEAQGEGVSLQVRPEAPLNEGQAAEEGLAPGTPEEF